MSFSSLNPELVSQNDKFHRAQWIHTPREVDEEICKDLKMSGVRNIKDAVYKIYKMVDRDFNYYIDPLGEMFLKIREKRYLECKIYCSDPDKHFSEKKCFPIFKIYAILKDIDRRAANHIVSKNFRDEVMMKINVCEKEEPIKDREKNSYPVYKLPKELMKTGERSKTVVLTIDFVNLEKFNTNQLAYYNAGLTNLLDNIDTNFTCLLAPQFTEDKKVLWIPFISQQFNNCDMLLFVLTRRMMEVLQEMLPSVVSLITGEQQQEQSQYHLLSPNNELNQMLSISSSNNTCSVGSSVEHLKLLWNKIKQSGKPLASIVFDEDLEMTATQFTSVVFYLPRNIQLLLGYILHRLNND